MSDVGPYRSRGRPIHFPLRIAARPPWPSCLGKRRGDSLHRGNSHSTPSKSDKSPLQRHRVGRQRGGRPPLRHHASLSLRATVNPDFGQVEADPSQINLTAFETFFPEKRPFFLEGTDIFSVQGPQLFYSRRIGRETQGPLPSEADHSMVPDRTTILGAAKLTGRTAGGWEVGLLEAVTAREHASYLSEDGDRGDAVVAPRTNYSTTRVQKNMGDGRRSVGGILTTTNRLSLPGRLDKMHEAAYAGGIDGRHRFAGETYEANFAVFGSVRGSSAALQATQRAPTHYYQRPDASHLTLDSTRSRLHGWSTHATLDKIAGRWRWNVEAAATSPGFEINDLGYLRSADEMSGEVGLTYVNSSPGAPLRQLRGWLQQEGSWTFGRERTDLELSYGGFARLKNNYSIRLRGSHGFRAFRRQPFLGALHCEKTPAWTAICPSLPMSATLFAFGRQWAPGRFSEPTATESASNRMYDTDRPLEQRCRFNRLCASLWIPPNTSRQRLLRQRVSPTGMSSHSYRDKHSPSPPELPMRLLPR